MALARLWEELPTEVQEIVLSFLPVPSLCRWRIVCKRWNRLISRCPKFSILCLQNAGKDYCYIVGRVAENVQTRHPEFTGWIVLDLEARRWYRMKHDRTLGETGDRRFTSVDTNSTFVATNAGLVCECVSQDGNDAIISIFNPLLRTTILRLPDRPKRCVSVDCDEIGILNFAVHDIDDSFKVFFINEGFIDHSNCGGFRDPEAILRHSLMPIYDSTDGQWQSSTNPLLPQERGVNYCKCSVMYRGLLYVLFMSLLPEDDPDYWLHSYDSKEDIWQDTGLHIKKSLSHHEPPQLIVSDGRLFLLAWMNLSEDVSNFSPFYRACEILLAERTSSMVFQLTSAQVQLDFDVQASSDNVPAKTWFDLQDLDLQAFGVKSSVILMSIRSGITTVYDLVSHSWDRLPRNPMMPLPEGCAIWFGKTIMNLRLPACFAAGVDGESVSPS